MSEDDARPDEPEEEPEAEDSSDPLTRWIAITLAAIALFGAGLAILQTHASINESNIARETTRTAEGALRANVVKSAAQNLEGGIEAERGALARRQAFVTRQVTGAGLDPAATLTEDEIAAAIAAAGGELPGQRTSAELRRLAFETEQLTLRQETLAETRVTWNDRSTQYTTAIAILAVALFLTGFALALKGPLRRVFYALGIAVALATFGFAAWVYSLPVPETPEDAIVATAQGSVDSADGRQTRAIAQFTEAIDTDDDFAAPYSRRAVARTLEANPDFQATGAFTGDVLALDEAVADARRALELTEDRDFLSWTLAAILSFSIGDYGDAVAAADEAIAINGQVPDLYLLRSAAEVGRGDAEAARASLEEFVGLVSGSDPSQRTREFVSAYVTYLEEVIEQTPEQADLARSLQQELIAIETQFNLGLAEPLPEQAPATGSVSVEGLRYEDDKLRVRISWQDLPAGTTLAAIGYERPAESGPGATWVQAPELALFNEIGGTGSQAGSVELERNCVPTEVRVDVYLDGELVESVTGPGEEATC